MQQQIIFSQDINQSLNDSIAEISFDKLYILTDEHTARLCLPLIAGFTAAHPHTVITIPSGDQAKNIDSLSLVWMRLSESGATRRSLQIGRASGRERVYVLV